MKKLVMAIFTVLFFSSSWIYAQEDTVITLPEITVTGSTKISNDLNKAFKKAFPGAEDLRWYKQNKDYLAKFIKDDVDHNSLFKKNGFLKYDISFGYEKNLPGDVLKMVQDAYTDFNITRAVNVKSAGRDIWVVNLEGMRNYVIVRVEDQALEEVKRMDKSR